MSDTKIDMAKVTQMLDSGWQVILFKNQMGSYTAQCLRNRQLPGTDHLTGQECDTDDFTPEQALTRLAYEIHGEIL